MDRQNLVNEIAQAIYSRMASGSYTVEHLAEAALQVIEAPASRSETYSRICNCGQNGFPENSPHSNHPHQKGCPQYVERS